MKKISLLLIFSLAVFSGFSIDDEKFKENLNNSRHLTELMVDEEYARRQKALAEERRAKREIETERSDEILGIKYHLETYHVVSGQFIKLEFFGKTGTFNVFCLPKRNKEVPLLSTADLFSSTGFCVRLDGEVYDCVRLNRVKKELRRLDNGAQLVYRLGNRVRLVLDFKLIASKADSPEDIVKVTAYAINEDRFAHTFDLRGILDTVCGEVSAVHFTTDNNSRIRNEARFSGEDMHVERTIVSSNGTITYQFVLDGLSVAPLEAVTLGNVDELHRMDWDTGFRKGRGFSNIRGYDDSGIMLDWAEDVLEPGQKTEKVFYIAVAANEEFPRGLIYVDNLVLSEGEEVAQEVQAEAVKQTENPVRRTDVEFIVPPIKDYQLDPEYIQQLIDKIDALQSSKEVNKTEIMRLNAELDAILEKLRRQ